MEKDAIRNQKVFVSLNAVLALQREYTQYRQDADDPNASHCTVYTRNGLERAILLLELPIPVRGQ